MTDDEFASAFENCELSNTSFHHRDHIRLAWIYLQRYGESEAAARIAISIRKFAAHHGKSDKYHETVTVAWMRLVAHAVQSSPGPFDLFAARNPALFDKSTLAAFYSGAALQSEAAKNSFILPDLKSLPE
jgi:hypothetical protein